MTKTQIRKSMYERIQECPMPPIASRGRIINLFIRYKQIIDIVKIEGMNFSQTRMYIHQADRVEKELTDLFRELVNRPFVGNICCRLIELGDEDFIHSGLDYEPEEIDSEEEEDEDEEAPCEICGKDRKEFTENLCEECFDNETDKYYDGGIDEDE